MVGNVKSCLLNPPVQSSETAMGMLSHKGVTVG